MTARHVLSLLLAGLVGCGSTQGTAPPPEGWANMAPTVVDQVVHHGEVDLLAVSQGDIHTWVRVPAVGAEPGDYVLLGQGTLERDVPIPGTDQRAPELVDIAHVQVVDLATAERVIRAATPADAVAIGAIYEELPARVDEQVVITGTVIKATNAVGWNWVHVQDGTGSAANETNDLTVKTAESVTVGQRVAFRGTLRQDVDLGFGYHYDALIEEGVLLQ